MRTLNKFKTILFTGALFFLSVVTFFNPSAKERYIPSENRMKQQFQEPTIRSLVSGEYMPIFESYFTDRFAFREQFLYGKSYLDLNIARKHTFSDSILSKDRTMLFRFREGSDAFDQDKFNNDIAQWAKIRDNLAAKNIPLIVIGIPDQSHMFTDRYPDFAENDAKHYAFLRNTFFRALKEKHIDHIDMHGILEEDRDTYYYLTDHHPNFHATMRIYEELIKKTHLKSILPDDVEIVKNPHRFMGSHNRKIFGLVNEDTHAAYAKPVEEIPYTIYENGKKTDEAYVNTESIYYAMYMGGDKPFTVIETNRENLPNILVLGDSTTNALESMLWMNADSLTSLDYRHYKGEDLIAFLEDHPQDLVVVSLISGYYDNLSLIMR